MSTQNIAATEYRNLPLAVLSESKTNPRRIFEDAALKELADSIRSQGVLSPLLVRPLNERSFEIVAGARRYRAAQMAESETIPVRIVNLTDAEALEAQLIENLQRRDVHPLEEAQGFRALLNLEEPKYSIEQIAAKTGKSPTYVAQRLKLTELSPTVVEAFYTDEIGVGHALLLAKLQPPEQEQALAACFREDWGGGCKSKRILLPVRNLQQWIEHNILLILKDAPFSKSDATLNPQAGACLDCPKRTGHNKLLFADVQQDACTDPACYQTKVDAHVAKTLAAKPKLVQISAAYGQPAEGSAAIPRNKYIEIKQEKPQNNKQRDWPEYKTCKSTTEAIITEGTEKGELRKICADPNCSVHHPKKQKPPADANGKAEQEKQRREEALAQATGWNPGDLTALWWRQTNAGWGHRPRLRILAGLAKENLAMRDRTHDEAMAEMFQENPAYALELLNSILEDGEQGELLIALRQMTKAFGGVQSVAEKAHLNPTQLYRTLSQEGNPELSSLAAILKAMGLRLAVERIHAA